MKLPDADQSNAIIAFFALLVAGLSVFFTYRGLEFQRRHNSLSVIPVPFIAFADYENLIRVKIRNDGIGPLIICHIQYALEYDIDRHNELVEYCPEPPNGMYWSNFSSGYIRSIRPGDELILVEVEIDIEDIEQIAYRDELRESLSKLSITVFYKDIYEQNFTPVSRDLKFFSRQISSSKRKH